MLNAALFGSLITIGTLVITAVFNLGKHAARIEELERWRNSIRVDMHEISDKLELLSKQIVTLTTLIEERTDRRDFLRHSK